MKNKNIYICGALFKSGDIKERLYEGKKLRELGYKNIFNPIEQPFNEDKTSSLPTAKEIFKGDTKAVLESDMIVAELDNFDEGVIAELAISWSMNFIKNKIQNITDKMNSKKDIKLLESIMEDIPYKELICHFTDIRLGSAGEYDGYHVPISANQYLIGMLENDKSHIYIDKDKMFEDLKKR